MSDILRIIIIVLISFFIVKIIDFIYKKIFKSKKQIHISFFKNLIKLLVIIVGLYNICSVFDVFQTFSKAILTSSSLLVVVLGFAFQTSLEDFIAGILISIFKPFNIDDRVNLTGLGIAGKIENITIRHTVIKTFTNSRLIIPNSKMNKEIIENSHIVDPKSSNFLDICITYDSDLNLAKEIIKSCIQDHPNTIDVRSLEEIQEGKPKVIVFIRNFGPNGVELRTSVWTENVDMNFLTCSEIRESIKNMFDINNIKIACTQSHITGDLNITTKKD